MTIPKVLLSMGAASYIVSNYATSYSLTAGMSLSLDYYNKGYTGHEHMDEVGLIHMNGRIYDARLGRFLNPDPVVQQPHNLQNLNRYSYVLNNPLNATDPSGYFWQSLINAAITYFSGGSWGDTLEVAFASMASNTNQVTYSSAFGVSKGATMASESWQKDSYDSSPIVGNGEQNARNEAKVSAGTVGSEVSGTSSTGNVEGRETSATTIPSKIFSSSDEHEKALRLISTTKLGGKIFGSLDSDDTIRYVELKNSNGPDLGITSKHGSGTRVIEGTEKIGTKFGNQINDMIHYKIAVNTNVEAPTFAALDKSSFTPDLTRIIAHEFAHIAVNERYIRNMTVIEIENAISRELNDTAPIRHPTFGH